MRSIVYTDISDPIRRAVEPIVVKWEHILPDWVRTLHVRELSHNDHAAEFTSQVRYRAATLHVAKIALAQADLEGTIVHEFCHAYTTPCAEPGKDYLKAHKVEGADLETAWARMDDHVEAATEDLKALILRLSAR
ncbi:MAG: hypothetical protein ABL962_12435 [Fimbriimonadaceae bacterium]